MIARDRQQPTIIQNRKPDPLGQVKEEWLSRKLMPWNDGILECWNTGCSGIRSILH